MYEYFVLMELLGKGYAFPDAGWYHETVVKAHQEIHDLGINKYVCSVENWVWVDIDVSGEEWTEITKGWSSRVFPAFLFSNKVLNDEAGRFLKDDYVRTSLLQTYHKGYIFETRNTAYCLIGEGRRVSVSLNKAANIFSGIKQW